MLGMFPNIVMTTDPAVGELGLKGAGTQEEKKTGVSALVTIPVQATTETLPEDYDFVQMLNETRNI